MTNASIISGHPCLNRTARRGDRLVFGDDEVPLPTSPSTISTAIGTGIPGGNPAMVLQAELNRFGLAPALDVDGRIDGTPNGMNTVARLGVVMQKRALDVSINPATSGSALPFFVDASKLIPTASGIAYVNANLPFLTAVVAGYADANGLPAASLPIGATTIALLAVAGIGLYLLAGRKRARSRR